MEIYKHTQPGSKLILGFCGLTELITVGVLIWTLFFCPSSGSCPASGWIGIIIIPITLIVFVMIVAFLSSMTIKIENDTLSLVFGPGILKKSFTIKDIESAEPVKNSFMHGWGVHYYQGSKVYNIAGFDAVEILLKNGKRIRIGTDEPDKLAEAIKASI